MDKVLSGELVTVGEASSPHSDEEESEPEDELPALRDQVSALPLQDEVSPNAQFALPRTAPLVKQNMPAAHEHRAFSLPSSYNQQLAVPAPLPNVTWPPWVHKSAALPSLVPEHVRLPVPAYQAFTPESSQMYYSSSFATEERPCESVQQITSTPLLDIALPDVNPHISIGHQSTARPDFIAPPFENEFRRPSMRHRNSHTSEDLETFFDELAILEEVKVENKESRFMQNLGFAPDAKMSDLLALEPGQHVPTNSSTLLSQSDDPTHLDPAFFVGR